MQTINTAMAEAFYKGAVNALANPKAKGMIERIIARLDKKTGQIKRKEWDAHLSRKTYLSIREECGLA